MRLLFEKRKSTSVAALVLVPIVSFLVSLVLTALLLQIFDANPFTTFAAMAVGAFGSSHGFAETLVKAIPLMLTGLGVAIAFKLKFWNIGAEGQLTMGGVAAAGVALFLEPYLPGQSLLFGAVLGGLIAGALWAGIPAILKTSLGVDETLVTLMMNYIAILYAVVFVLWAMARSKRIWLPGLPNVSGGRMASSHYGASACRYMGCARPCNCSLDCPKAHSMGL